MSIIVIHGRLKAKPEAREGFVTFTIVENHTSEKASYYSCRANLSDKQLQFMNQGTEVIVTGDLSINKVVKDEKTFTNIDVFVYNVKFAGSKKDAPEGVQ